MGLAYEREENFIFVMTEAEQKNRRQLARKLITKVYRPSYYQLISVQDLQALITPLLTETVGKVAVTNSSDSGISTDNALASGDSLAQSDALLVIDYADVIQKVDAVVDEMDVPPLQVVIDAMILSVKLTNEMDFDVNFALLSSANKDLVVSGNGRTLNRSSGFPGDNTSIVPPMGEFIADAAGLKYCFIREDISAFIAALETISDTNLIASPQLRVLNKQRAQLIIGERLSYTTTTFSDNQSIENVNFVDAGTKLIIRPFISPDAGCAGLAVAASAHSGAAAPQSLPQPKSSHTVNHHQRRRADVRSAATGRRRGQQRLLRA